MIMTDRNSASAALDRDRDMPAFGREAIHVARHISAADHVED